MIGYMSQSERDRLATFRGGSEGGFAVQASSSDPSLAAAIRVVVQ